MQSTIKPKVGKCLDCPPDSKEKPLTAKRCLHHYWIYREEVNSAKKPKEVKTRKAIPKRSQKRIAEDKIYALEKAKFMIKPENQKCPITGRQTKDVHHKMGRIGFADEWARLNNIPLLLDTRFWLAVSREGHRKIEENPEWAKENNYSLKRI